MMDELVVRDIDVLVIGGGLSGAFAAIKAKEAGAGLVVQVDKAYMGRSGCSAFGAGVMRSFFPDEDDRERAFFESVTRSHYLCDQERLDQHLDDCVHRVREMDSFGVGFEKTPDGKFKRIMARGVYKRLMFRGGYSLMGPMRKAVEGKGIRIVDRVMLVDLLTDGNKATGAVGFDTSSGQPCVFLARSIVMGAGRGWMKGRRPGHRNVTGDGITAAYRAGATLVGFDATAPNTGPAAFDIGPGNNILLGFGGVIVNADGDRFIHKYDPNLQDKAELHVVSTACAIEARRGKVPIHLDMSAAGPDQVQQMKRVLPLPMMMYERAGIVVGDHFVRKVEWVVEGPTSEGGLLIDTKYQTTLQGLFACGDAMPMLGPEGQTALPGAMTSGARAGKYAAEYARQVSHPAMNRGQVDELEQRMYRPLNRKDGIEPDQVLLSVQETLAPYDVLSIRHEKRLLKALDRVESIWKDEVPLLKAYDPHYLRMAIEAANICQVGLLMLKSSLLRKESREVLREDYPYLDNADWLKLVTANRNGDDIKIGTVDVPLQRYKLKPKREKVLNPIWRVAEAEGQVRIEGGQVSWA